MDAHTDGTCPSRHRTDPGPATRGRVVGKRTRGAEQGPVRAASWVSGPCGQKGGPDRRCSKGGAQRPAKAAVDAMGAGVVTG